MDGPGLEGIIDLELEEEDAAANVKEGRDGADDEGGPGLDAVARRGNTDETREGAVEDGNKVVAVVLELDYEQGCETAGGGGEGGSDGAAGGRVGAGALEGAIEADGGGEGEGGAGVEAVPAEPEDERAEGAEGGGVAGHGDGVALGVEATKTGPDDDGAHQAGKAADHVDDAAAGKVNHAGAEEKIIGLEGGEPPLSRPDPVGDDGVDKGAEEEGVAEVGVERGALGDRAGHDGGGGGGEGPLEEKEVEAVRAPGASAEIGEVGEGEVGLANEDGVALVGLVTVGEGKTEDVVR
mmetsp:Transcript_13757/g.35109  ORF Transcript_13757/g.35109 Transcript_13757/m.35109 type:complete len:295 (+) Transcript_13757:562-1446(+)